MLFGVIQGFGQRTIRQRYLKEQILFNCSSVTWTRRAWGNYFPGSRVALCPRRAGHAFAVCGAITPAWRIAGALPTPGTTGLPGRDAQGRDQHPVSTFAGTARVARTQVSSKEVREDLKHLEPEVDRKTLTAMIQKYQCMPEVYYEDRSLSM